LEKGFFVQQMSQPEVVLWFTVHGTLTNFYERIAELWNTNNPDRQLDEVEFWTRIKRGDAELKAFKNSVDRSPKFNTQLKPLPNCIETIRALQKAGFTIKIANSADVQSPTGISDVQEWIINHFDHDMAKHLTFTSDKTLLGKGHFVPEVAPDGTIRAVNEVHNILFSDRDEAARGSNPQPLWTQLYYKTKFHPEHHDQKHIFDGWDFDKITAAIREIVEPAPAPTPALAPAPPVIGRKVHNVLGWVFPILVYLFVDLDGCIADFYGQIIRALVERGELAEADGVDFWKRVKAGDPEAKRMKESIDRQPGFYKNLPIFEGAYETVVRLFHTPGFCLFFFDVWRREVRHVPLWEAHVDPHSFWHRDVQACHRARQDCCRLLGPVHLHRPKRLLASRQPGRKHPD